MTETTTETAADFKAFAGPVRARFEALAKDELYTTAGADALFDLYLAAFPAAANPVVRARRLYDCQTCKRFVRRVGGLVGIRNGRVLTLWEGLSLPEPFATVAAALDAAVRAAPVTGVFRTKEAKFGEDHNYDPKTNERHDHFCGEVAARHRAADPGPELAKAAAAFQVLQRGLAEVRQSDLLTVLELIDANGLYRGEEHRPAVVGFLELATLYAAPGVGDKTLFVWEHLAARNALFRNTVIGTLLVDLAEGKPLDDAVRAFETKVAPANYKRPTAVITPRMVEAAVQTLTDLGLHGALARRYARLSDVSVNDVLFVDNGTRGRMKDGVAALLEDSVKRTPPDLSRATKMPADEFVSSVLPGARTVDLFLENRHQGNFVALTGADGPERPFRWGNNFAWSYDGDVADSVKQRVKAAGGNVQAELRVSLSWFNTDDLDLHAYTPDGRHVYFGAKQGILDVDMNAGACVRNPVENLAFNGLVDGVYRVTVHQFHRRETTDVGFELEVEYAGAVHRYSHPKAVQPRQEVPCLSLHVAGRKLVRIETALAGGTASQEKWGVKTETLVPVAAAMYSPNHWGDSRAGARHLIFALKNCRNPGSTRGFFNEFLRPDLEAHRKVFEVLASKTKCPYADDQVAGVGFTAARGDSVTVVVDGKRAYTLTF